MQVKKIFKLENLIYLTIFALPAYLLRFNWWIFPTNVLDILLIVCFVLWLIFYRETVSYKAFFDKYKSLIFSTGIVFAGLIISVLLNKNYAIGFGIIKSWFLLPVLFSLVSSFVIEENKRKNIFLAYYLSAFSVAVISLVYYLFGVLTFDLRLQGFFNSPNYLAMYLAPASFIGYALFWEIDSKRKLIIASSSLLILFALYLTYSYASWLALFGAIILALALTKKLSWKKWLAALFLLIALIFSQLEKSKLTKLINFDSRSSLSSRVMIWQSAEKILESDWLIGIGAGNFQSKYLEDQKYFPPYLEWAVPHPHNLYLTFWLYGGIFSLLGFLALVYFWFSRVFRSQKNPRLKLLGLGIMCYILLHGLLDTTYFKNDLAVAFWLLFVLL